MEKVSAEGREPSWRPPLEKGRESIYCPQYLSLDFSASSPALNQICLQRIKEQALTELKGMCCFLWEYLHGRSHLC